jgi:hypothetical protein
MRTYMESKKTITHYAVKAFVSHRITKRNVFGVGGGGVCESSCALITYNTMNKEGFSCAATVTVVAAVLGYSAELSAG